MCGIAGIYRFDGRPVERSTLEAMREASRHRGPDDTGLHLSGSVGLAHNRLSILDLSPNAHQPMYDAVAGRWVVYNGEIYNFRSIRDELAAHGCRFHSSGDTEVILQAYRVWGSRCLERFNGMFALAIYDEANDSVFLARDRLGIKPLYYYTDGHQFVFASETKSILLAGGVPRRVDRDALPELIAFRYLTGGRTLFEGIRELEPGCELYVSRRGVRERRYWDIPFARAESDDAGEDWLEGLEERLQQSVAYRLIADVPVGCALSGGVDSSLVTAMACEASRSEMKSFSIGFDLPQFDERPYAQELSQRLGIENYSCALGEKEFYERLPALTWHMDEPINHPNSVGIWLLAKVAREKVTVLLSGEGGDELMGGYGRFRTVLELARLQGLLPGLRTVMGLLPQGLGGRAGRAVRELGRDGDGQRIWSSAYMPSHLVERLCGPGAVERAEASRRELLARAPTDDPIERHLYLELKTYLVSLLMRVDKMCMAHGLENRVPLLDHELVEYVARMPASLKVDRRRGKRPLFELVERRFGTELFRRPKMGFGLPLPYFQGEGYRWLEGLITSRSFRERELVDRRAVEELLRIHRAGKELPADAMWILATTELWARTFVDAPGMVIG